MQKTKEIHYEKFNDLTDLPEDEQQLIVQARNALESAYAPYSGFEVAAAIYLENGEILVGTNQENASYGLCLCAEQNVLATAGSQFGSVTIKKMAITARAAAKDINYPISPCGACRQVISEHEDRHQHPIKIILQGASGDILTFQSIKELLPFSFSAKDLA